MPRSGLANTRANARVLVLRGFDPNAPTTLTLSLPVASGVTILSGQVVAPVWSSAHGSHAFALGLTAAPPCIALQDSADEDVSEAGKLTGLSCAGQFEIQTAFYSGADSTFTIGKVLSAHATSGDVIVATAGGTNANGSTIIGHVTRVPKAAVGDSVTSGGITITSSYSGGSGSATGPGAIFYPGENSNVTAPEKVLTFATTYTGNKLV